MKRIYAILCLSFVLGGCATISKDDCQLGAWGDYGYEDGLNGRQSDRITKYVKKCSEFGVTPDREAYFSGYERGVVQYCSYQRGYEIGQNGGSYNQVCTGELAAEFAPGYDEGRALYQIKQDHQSRINRVLQIEEALAEIRRKLDEDMLPKEERRRLEKKYHRLEAEFDEARIDLRAYERSFNLPRHNFN